MSEAKVAIGTIVKISGKAFAESDGHSHPLVEGSKVCEGETVVTLDGSKVEIRFTDNTVLSQGENSRIELDEYVYEGDKGAAGLLFNMVQGSFRTVTGKIVEQNPEGFNLSSPLATIGIRGTTTFHFVSSDMEKHGVQDIENPSLGGLDTPLHGMPSGYHTMLITYGSGESRVISDSYQMVDMTPEGMGMIRTFTLSELLDFIDLSAHTPEERQSLTDTLFQEFREQAPPELRNESRPSLDNPNARDSGDGDQDGDGNEQSDHSEIPPEIAQLLASLPPPRQIIDDGGDVQDEWIEPLREAIINDITTRTFATDSGESNTDQNDITFTLIGTAGNDTIVGSELSDIIQGLAGDDSLSGRGSNDFLHGGVGNDTLHGDAGNDFLYGGAGNDTIYGGEGDDYVQAGEAGHNTYLGDDGNDWLSYAGSQWGMTINLMTGSAYDGDSSSAHYVFDDISGFESIIGSQFNDTINGYDTKIIIGGAGNDILSNAESLFGGLGDDTLVNAVGPGYLDGGDGDDTLHGGTGDDTLVGGAGNDVMHGEAGDNWISYALTGGTKGWAIYLNDSYEGESPEQTASHAIGAESNGNIIYETDQFYDVSNIEGSHLDDTISGNADNNYFKGLSGNDSLFGYAGDDSIDGGQCNDTIDGGSENDLLAGGDGNDALVGDTGNDTILGGAGNDSVWGDDGIDSLHGGSGADTFYFEGLSDGLMVSTNEAVSGQQGDLINDFVSGEDKINLSHPYAYDDFELILDETNFIVIDGLYSGDNATDVQGAYNWSSGKACLIFDKDVASDVCRLIYDSNGDDPGYHILTTFEGSDTILTDQDVVTTTPA